MAKRHPTTLGAQEHEYLMAYGGLPTEREDLLDYVIEKYPFAPKTLEKIVERQDHLSWEEMNLVLYLIPKPTPRPRTDGNHFYVKGAAENKKYIKRFLDRRIIATRCEAYMRAYLPTPTSILNNAEIYLAELGRIRPISSVDIDNLMKTYLDAIQGHLLFNDSLVTYGEIEKFFSIRPRLEFTIRYQVGGYDSKYNEKHVKSSKPYKECQDMILEDLKLDHKSDKVIKTGWIVNPDV